MSKPSVKSSTDVTAMAAIAITSCVNSPPQLLRYPVSAEANTGVHFSTRTGKGRGRLLVRVAGLIRGHRGVSTSGMGAADPQGFARLSDEQLRERARVASKDAVTRRLYYAHRLHTRAPEELEQLISAVEDRSIDPRYEASRRVINNVASVVTEDGAVSDSGAEPVKESEVESMAKCLVEGDADGARAVFGEVDSRIDHAHWVAHYHAGHERYPDPRRLLPRDYVDALERALGLRG